jgi:hypothetical protein
MIAINKPKIKLSRLYLIVGLILAANALNWLLSSVQSAPYVQIDPVLWEIFIGLLLYTVYRFIAANIAEVTG